MKARRNQEHLLMNTRNIANNIFNSLHKLETILKKNNEDIRGSDFIIQDYIKPAIDGLLLTQQIIANQLQDLRTEKEHEPSKEVDRLIIDVALPAKLKIDDDEFDILNHEKKWSSRAGFEQWMELRIISDPETRGQERIIVFFQDNTYMLKMCMGGKILKEGKIRDLIIKQSK